MFWQEWQGIADMGFKAQPHMESQQRICLTAGAAITPRILSGSQKLCTPSRFV